MRNMEKAVKQGRAITEKRPGLDLSFSELMELREMISEDPKEMLWDAISFSYRAGLAVGYRNGGKG